MTCSIDSCVCACVVILVCAKDFGFKSKLVPKVRIHCDDVRDVEVPVDAKERRSSHVPTCAVKLCC